MIVKNWELFDECDFEKISTCGYRIEDHIKYQVEQDNGYRSLFYFYVKMGGQEIRETAEKIFSDTAFGNVHRIKGFVETQTGRFIQINAVPGRIVIEERDRGQNALIVIGENLNRELIDKCFVKKAKYHGVL